MSKRKTVTVVRYLAQHDGDDRTGELSGMLLDLLAAREVSVGSRAFQSVFDKFMDQWARDLEARDE